MVRTGPATATRLHPARRRLPVVLPWLLALYVLALGTPVFQSLIARAAVAEAVFVELCTGSGIQKIALGAGGDPVEHAPTGQHAGHDCAACFSGCSQHGLCGAPHFTLLKAEPPRALAAPLESDLVATRPAAQAPLPARGPPTLS